MTGAGSILESCLPKRYVYGSISTYRIIYSVHRDCFLGNVKGVHFSHTCVRLSNVQIFSVISGWMTSTPAVSGRGSGVGTTGRRHCTCEPTWSISV